MLHLKFPQMTSDSLAPPCCTLLPVKFADRFIVQYPLQLIATPFDIASF